VKCADLLVRGKCEVTPCDIERRQWIWSSATREYPQNLAEALSPVAFRADDKLMQGFAGSDSETISEDSLSLVNLRDHIVYGQAGVRFSVKHLPEVGNIPRYRGSGAW